MPSGQGLQVPRRAYADEPHSLPSTHTAYRVANADGARSRKHDGV